MSTENIRVFHQPRNSNAHRLDHEIVIHEADFGKEVPLRINVSCAKLIVKELDRLQAIEYEYNAMVAEQDARREATQ